MSLPWKTSMWTVKLTLAAYDRCLKQFKRILEHLSPHAITGSILGPSADTSESGELKTIVTCLHGSLERNYLAIWFVAAYDEGTVFISIFIPFLLTIISHSQTNITSEAWKDNERYKNKTKQNKRMREEEKWRLIWNSGNLSRGEEIPQQKSHSFQQECWKCRDFLFSTPITTWLLQISNWWPLRGSLFYRKQCLKFKFPGSV